MHQSGCADVRVPDDETLARVHAARGRAAAQLGARRLLPRRRRQPSSRASRRARARRARSRPTTARPTTPIEVLARLVRPEPLLGGDARASGEEMICGVGRVGGLYAGFVINRQGLVGDPEHPDEQPPGGDPLPRRHRQDQRAFSRACNDDGIPLIWLQDISGFDIGARGRAAGAARATARASSTPTAPTRCRCSRCCCARPPAPATTP